MAEIVTTPITDRSPSWLNRLSPQAVFLLVAGFFGLAMAFITPPVQIPDEPHHWFRVYQLSQGKMIARKYGGDIPASMDAYQSNVFAAISYHPANKASVEYIRSRFDVPLNPRVTHFVTFPNNTLYTILPYAPQTLTMFIARKLKWPAIGLMYAGRVGTVFGYLLVGWWAIRITPILKWPACLVLTSPMALFLAGSLSADPMTTAICFLATAIALRCIVSPGVLSRNMVVALFLAMIAVGLSKPAYVPLTFLVFAIPGRNWGGRYRRWLIPIAIPLVTVILLAIWSSLAGSSHVKEEHAIGIQLQMPWVLHHPVNFLGVLRRSVVMYWSEMATSAVGLLGWVDTPLQSGVIDFVYIALAWVTVAYDEPLRLALWPRMVAFIALLVTLLAILTANYLAWAQSVGFPYVQGLQGRYLLPIAMLACIVFRRPGKYPVQPRWMLAMLSAIALYTLWVVIERYYLPSDLLSKLLSGAPSA